MIDLPKSTARICGELPLLPVISVVESEYAMFRCTGSRLAVPAQSNRQPPHSEREAAASTTTRDNSTGVASHPARAVKTQARWESNRRCLVGCCAHSAGQSGHHVHHRTTATHLRRRSARGGESRSPQTSNPFHSTSSFPRDLPPAPSARHQQAGRGRCTREARRYGSSAPWPLGARQHLSKKADARARIVSPVNRPAAPHTDSTPRGS